MTITLRSRSSMSGAGVFTRPVAQKASRTWTQSRPPSLQGVAFFGCRSPHGTVDQTHHRCRDPRVVLNLPDVPSDPSVVNVWFRDNLDQDPEGIRIGACAPGSPFFAEVILKRQDAGGSIGESSGGISVPRSGD